MKNKKVLIVPNAEITKNGAEYRVEKSTGAFAHELQQLGVAVTIFGQFVEEENNIHVYNLKKKGIMLAGCMRRKNKIVNYILLHVKVVYYILRSDFVYLFYPNAFKYVAVMCKFLSRPYGLYIRGSDDMTGKLPSFLYRNSAVVFCVSNYFTNHVNNNVGAQRAFSIRPMIDLTHKDIVVGRNYTTREFYRILYLGRIAEDKGIEELLHAVAVLRDKGYRFVLDVVGDGEHFYAFSKLASDLQLEDFVKFRGATFNPNEIRNYFQNADIFVLASYHEGFPRTLYEAMAYGTPIITTFVGGVASVMTDGRNCLRIEPRSVNSIVAVLANAMDNYAKTGVLAKNATTDIKIILQPGRLSHAQDVYQILSQN